MSSLKASRGNQLQRTITAASWWLMVQGFLYTFMGDRLSSLLRLRYQSIMEPYICLAGLALICLGLFVNRAVREASRQYLAVDTLLLFFISLCIFTLHQRLLREDVFWFEWLSFALNLGLAGALVTFRTRGSEMQAPGSLVAFDAMEALKQAQSWAKTLKDRKPAEGPVAAPEPVSAVLPDAAPPAPELAPSPAPKPKPSSEAMPHMD